MGRDHVLSLEKQTVFIPDDRLSVMDLELQTGLPKSMLSIFKLIYGLNTISIWKSDLKSLLKIPLENLFSDCMDQACVKYVIYVHTAGWVSLIDDSVEVYLKKYFSFSVAHIWESSLYKCVGYFKAVELLQRILLPNDLGLIITGEVAFTPKLRVVPRSTIVGDAATASLFSLSGMHHYLLSVKTKLIEGYEKGIYLSDAQLYQFEKKYINKTISVIFEALHDACISLSEIKMILPHNVNIPTWQKIAEALQFPIEKIYLDNIPRFGHSFCSDHLINLQSVIADGYLNFGDYYLMVGCGLGFFISAAVWRY